MMTHNLTPKFYPQVSFCIVKDDPVRDRFEVSFKNGSSSLKTMTWFVVMKDGLL